MIRQVRLFSLFVLLWLCVPLSHAQWGQIRKEQIEDVYLRQDRAETMRSATASLVIRADQPGAGHVLLQLNNGSAPVFKAGLPGYLVLDSTAAVKHQGSHVRALAVAEDSGERAKPVIYYGTCNDGAVSYTGDGFRTAFASGCVPVVALTPVDLMIDDGDNYYWYVLYLSNSTASGFTYYIIQYRRTIDGEFQGPFLVTSLYTVHWMAMGWVD